MLTSKVNFSCEVNCKLTSWSFTGPVTSYIFFERGSCRYWFRINTLWIRLRRLPHTAFIAAFTTSCVQIFVEYRAIRAFPTHNSVHVELQHIRHELVAHYCIKYNIQTAIIQRTAKYKHTHQLHSNIAKLQTIQKKPDTPGVFEWFITFLCKIYGGPNMRISGVSARPHKCTQ